MRNPWEFRSLGLIQVFGGLLVNTVSALFYACGEETETLKEFTHILVEEDLAMKSFFRFLVHAIRDRLDKRIWHCKNLYRINIWPCKSFVLPSLPYGCEARTLTRDLEVRIKGFGNRCFCRIMRYRWKDCVKSAAAP